MTNFICEVDNDYSSACQGLPEYQDTGYCVLHSPSESKRKHFEQVKQDKLFRKDYDFSGTVFPEGTSRFRARTFGTEATFRGAVFVGEANFARAKFERESSFRSATFRGKADFSKAEFRKQAGFRRVTFEKEAHFNEAIFNEEARFRRATFNSSVEFEAPSNTDSDEAYSFKGRANFSRTRFGAGVTFVGGSTFDVRKEEVSFRFALTDRPERFMLDRVILRPSWFIDMDARNLRFINVRWSGLPDGPRGSIEEEVRAIENRRQRRMRNREKEDSPIDHPTKVLAKTCRELSSNAEENRDYPLANEFHYWSMDALRKQSWSHLKGLTPRGLLRKQTWRDIGQHFGLITALYWALSGYGVRAARAFWMLVALWAAFTTLYVLVDPTEFKDFGQGIGYRWQAAVYSLLVLARLNPEPRPEEPGVFQFLVGLEGILGPLQIALLALAVRRKVMR